MHPLIAARRARIPEPRLDRPQLGGPGLDQRLAIGAAGKESKAGAPLDVGDGHQLPAMVVDVAARLGAVAVDPGPGPVYTPKDFELAKIMGDIVDLALARRT